MSLSPEEKAILVERIKKALSELGEHFDTVQLIATCHDKTTPWFSYGTGNFYARLGACREWLIVEDELTRQGARAAANEGDDEDEDEDEDGEEEDDEETEEEEES